MDTKLLREYFHGENCRDNMRRAIWATEHVPLFLDEIDRLRAKCNMLIDAAKISLFGLNALDDCTRDQKRAVLEWLQRQIENH